MTPEIRAAKIKALEDEAVFIRDEASKKAEVFLSEASMILHHERKNSIERIARLYVASRLVPSSHDVHESVKDAYTKAKKDHNEWLYGRVK